MANRIGRLIATRGDVIDALFDPQSLPDLLTELAVSDATLRTCAEMPEGVYDELPTAAFYFAVGIDEIRKRVRQWAPE